MRIRPRGIETSTRNVSNALHLSGFFNTKESSLSYKTQQNCIKRKRSGLLSTPLISTPDVYNLYKFRSITGLSFSDEQTIYYYIYSYTVKVIIVLFIASEFWYLFSVSSSFDTVIDNITVTVLHFIYLYRYKSMVS